MAAWVIPAITALGMFLNRGSGSSAAGAPVPMEPEMKRMLAEMERRMTTSTPLYNDTIAMAQRMLPKFARGAGNRTSNPNDRIQTAMDQFLADREARKHTRLEDLDTRFGGGAK